MAVETLLLRLPNRANASRSANSGTECPCPVKNSVNWEAAEEYVRTDAITLGFRVPLRAPVRIGSGLAGEIGHNANRVPVLIGTSIDLGAAGRHDGLRPMSVVTRMGLLDGGSW